MLTLLKLTKKKNRFATTQTYKNLTAKNSGLNIQCQTVQVKLTLSENRQTNVSPWIQTSMRKCQLIDTKQST